MRTWRVWVGSLVLLTAICCQNIFAMKENDHQALYPQGQTLNGVSEHLARLRESLRLIRSAPPKTRFSVWGGKRSYGGSSRTGYIKMLCDYILSQGLIEYSSRCGRSMEPKRAQTFRPWGGKRSPPSEISYLPIETIPDNVYNNILDPSTLEKDSREWSDVIWDTPANYYPKKSFSSWGGKRNVKRRFNSWAGKRSYTANSGEHNDTSPYDDKSSYSSFYKTNPIAYSRNIRSPEETIAIIKDQNANTIEDILKKIPVRRSFNPWAGKRQDNHLLTKQFVQNNQNYPENDLSIAEYQKNSKENNDKRVFNAWGGKRSPTNGKIEA